MTGGVMAELVPGQALTGAGTVRFEASGDIRDRLAAEEMALRLAALDLLAITASEAALLDVEALSGGDGLPIIRLHGAVAARAASWALSPPTVSVDSTESTAYAAAFAYVLAGPRSRVDLLRAYRAELPRDRVTRRGGLC